jgi:plasmid stabilization system protein ParE
VIAHLFHPEAALEFEEAALFYESRIVGLGKSYAAEINRTVALIQEFPDAGAPLYSNLRHVRIDRFPYSVVYRRNSESVVIVAVAHQRRRPGYWRGRK